MSAMSCALRTAPRFPPSSAVCAARASSTSARTASACVDASGANPATFPLDPSGTNAVPASSSSSRFFRLKAAER